MYLYTRNKEPKIAKRDIKVIVCLRNFETHYETLSDNERVEFGKPITAKCNGYPTESDNKAYQTDITYPCKPMYIVCNEGIHALVHDMPSKTYDLFKGIIPKGTEYWTDHMGLEIAARKMIVTDEAAEIDTDYLKDVLDGAPERNGIHVGDILTEDNKFVRPYDKPTSHVGTVCGFYDDCTPMICAPDTFIGHWHSWLDWYGGDILTGEQAANAFNGKEMTERNMACMKYGAFNECARYGDGKWFLPSTGEMMTMLDNTLYLDAAHTLSGTGFSPNDHTFFLTATESSPKESFICILLGVGVFIETRPKSCDATVVPFRKWKP